MGWGSEMQSIALLLALISVALFAWVLGSEADEIAFLDLAVFIAALVIILSVQIVALYGLWKLLLRVKVTRVDTILIMAAAILVGMNAYFFAFYTLEQPDHYRITCSVFVALAFLAFVSTTRLRPLLALFAGIMLVMSTIQYVHTRIVVLADVDVSSEIASLPINSKRNVYIIGFESMQSPTAYRKNFGLGEFEHTKVLEEAGFRVVDPAYSAERSTRRSYANIFEFKRSARGVVNELETFSTDNSTFKSFRDSGYGIQILYKNNYFPVNRKKVDYFFPRPAFDACDELGSWYFYGLCERDLTNDLNENVLNSPKISWKQQAALLRWRTD